MVVAYEKANMYPAVNLLQQGCKGVNADKAQPHGTIESAKEQHEFLSKSGVQRTSNCLNSGVGIALHDMLTFRYLLANVETKAVDSAR